MDNIILFIKGIIIGIGRIIPGVSGSIIAISLGVYERGINAINNFFENILENIKFLIIIGSGVMISIILLSKLIINLLDSYYFYTILFFIGLILGSVPALLLKIKGHCSKTNIFIFIITFILVSSLVLCQTDSNSNIIKDNLFVYFVIGLIDAATMIVPGISGTAVLIILGLYQTMLNLFANLTNLSLILLNIKMITFYGFGLLLGILIFVKLIAFLFKNHRISTYFAINAFVISSIILMLVSTLNNNYTVPEILIALVLLVLGYKISSLLFNES